MGKLTLVLKDSKKKGKSVEIESKNPEFNIAQLIKLAQEQGDGQGDLPVDKWEPEYCGEMDMKIKRNGEWWHEGRMITRFALVKLFARILRKDADGRHYLVTPVEKIGIEVECAAFLGVRCDVRENSKDKSRQRIFVTTNVGEVIEISSKRPLRMEIDQATKQNMPLVRVRGRLDALLSRASFYELVSEHAFDNGDKGFGVYANNVFFPLAVDMPKLW